MKRILLIGKNGQMGCELAPELPQQYDVLALDKSQLDLSVPDQIIHVVRDWRPHIVVNAAAYTAVDKAENEQALALAANGIAPGILAEECKRMGALLVHYSTDYVFDGEKSSPYDEYDLPNPVNAYGRSKLAGEDAIRASGVRHLILRTSWVYGLHGKNFLLTMLRLSHERDELRIVADQHGTPNWSQALAKATIQLIGMEAEGLYHLTSQGDTTWFGFAKAIFSHPEFSKKSLSLIPLKTEEYPLPARRPANSRLSGAALKAATGIELPDWNIALRQCLSGFTSVS